MWPKLFELLPGLLEALPHLDRFSAVAERLLDQRPAAAPNPAPVQDPALPSLAEDLRADLSRIDATHVAANAVLTSKLDELSTLVTTTATDAQASRSVTVALGHTIVAIERQLRALRAFVITLIILASILILMLGWILLTQPTPK